MIKRAPLAAIALAMFAAQAGPALGASCRDVEFPDKVRLGNAELALNGLGLRKATIFAVRVYVGALYLPQKSSDPARILGGGPWRMELRFVRDVGASDMREAWQDGFAKSAPDKLSQLQPRIDALKAAMTDLKTGQSLVFANDPAAGITVAVNGQRGQPIAGPDFATALIGIWLGPTPPNPDLKSGLLGGPCE